jgi:hypothetical protein
MTAAGAAVPRDFTITTRPTGADAVAEVAGTAIAVAAAEAAGPDAVTSARR